MGITFLWTDNKIKKMSIIIEVKLEIISLNLSKVALLLL